VPSGPPTTPERASWWPLLDTAAGRPSAPPAPLSDPPSSGEHSRPGIGNAAIDRLASICGVALATLEERIDLLDEELDETARSALTEARRLCTTVAVLSELV